VVRGGRLKMVLPIVFFSHGYMVVADTFKKLIVV